ncbi:MAG: rhodanese-like domain-containing protein [Thermoproteota archaeon]
MIISYSWLAEHLNDENIVILDSRGNVAYSYAHIPNSQPLGLEKVVKTNQYGANLVLEELTYLLN